MTNIANIIRKNCPFELLVGLMTLTLTISLILIVAAVSFCTVYNVTVDPYSASTPEKVLYLIGAALFLVAVSLGWQVLANLGRSEDGTQSIKDYNRYLTGVGYSLVLLAMLNFIALAGFAKTGQLTLIMSAGYFQQDTSLSREVKPVHHVLFVVLMAAFAILGALFFHANSLKSKRNNFVIPPPVPNPIVPAAGTPIPPAPAAGAEKVIVPPAQPAVEVTTTPACPPEPFNSAQFWSGLWFRMGEALLFTLVIFMLAVASGSKVFGNATMLLVALFMGMFVKTGEKLISGIADKVFASVQALVK